MAYTIRKRLSSKKQKQPRTIPKNAAIFTRKRLSPIKEKPANPKNWSKLRYYKPWTPKGLLGFVGILQQGPGSTLRGFVTPGPSTLKNNRNAFSKYFR